MDLKMFTSPKTTWAAIVGLTVVILHTVYVLFLDGDPATNPDFTVVISVVSACIGLLFARDNNVTSEEAGAVKPPTP